MNWYPECSEAAYVTSIKATQWRCPRCEHIDKIYNLDKCLDYITCTVCRYRVRVVWYWSPRQEKP